MNEVRGLTCQTENLCLAVGFDGEEDVVVVGTGARDSWTVGHLPHPAGETVFLTGLACSSATLCYAWGNAGAATIWVTTAPASGPWQRHVLGTYPDPGTVESVTCPSTGLCIAATDAIVNGEAHGGAAWVTQDIAGDSWAASPLDALHAVGNVDCAGFMCVIEGQYEDETGYVQASLWSTADVRSGVWSRTQPSVPYDDLDTFRQVQCLSASLCVVNAVAASEYGDTIYEYPGYFTSTTPATGPWDWHRVDTDGAAIGPLTCRAVGECLVFDFSGVSVEPDPTDDVPPVLVGIQHENALNLHGLFCLDASTCLAWGSDSGGASAGASIATRVWRGSSSGGAWSGAVLPLPAGDTTDVPVAESLACAGLTCTAVGAVIDSLSPPSLVVGPVVWTAAADGVWHLVAAGSSAGSGGGGSVTKVASTVSIHLKSNASPPRLKGKVSAPHGCQKSRRVQLVGRFGVPAATVKSATDGRYSVRLTRNVRSHLGSRVWVKVTERWRGTDIRCLAARSSRIRL